MKRITLVLGLTAAFAAQPAFASTPTNRHIEVYKHVYHRARHRLGLRAVGCQLFRTCRNQFPSDRKVVISTHILERMLYEHRRIHVIETAKPSLAYGDWAIPAYIVECESHFQNMPPNYAGASGYYQIIPSTWIGYGGGQFASQAYLASKSAQDLIASRIWDGGAGASQWTCAG